MRMHLHSTAVQVQLRCRCILIVVLMTYLATVWLVTMHGSVNGGVLLHIYGTVVDSEWFTNSSQQCCNRVYNFPLNYKTFTIAGLQPG
jgi:hypothetical protein